MAFKGRIMALQIMQNVPVVCLWCACDANDVSLMSVVVPVGFL
jgi:hypothetical protein